MLRSASCGACCCVLVACMLALSGSVVGAGAQENATSQATTTHESGGVRNELARISKPSGPTVGPATPAGSKWTLPSGARLIESDTTADSETWALPNGHHLTRVFATPVNRLSAAGKWQRMSAAEHASAVQASSATSSADVSPDTEERPLGEKPEAACMMSSSEPTKSACGTSLSAGYTSSPVATKRSLLKFTMPYDSEELTILSARLELDVASTTTKETAAMGVYRVTTPWTTSATWNTSNGSTNWKTAGGDFANNSEAAINPAVGASKGWVYWNPTEMLQRWFNGTGAPAGQSNPDLGFLVKDVSEGTTNNMVTFSDSEYENEPSLSYESAPRGVGVSSQYTLLSTQLTPTSTMSVNAASGDLLLQSTDLQIAGRGISFSSERDYNSLSAAPYGYGESWGDSNSSHVLPEAEGTLAYTDSTGEVFAFLKSGVNYITPPGIDATMCAAGSEAPCPKELPSGVKYEIVFTPSEVHIGFGHNGPGGEGYFPTIVEDHYGNSMKASYTSGIEDPTKWTDTEGRKIEYTETNPYEGYTKITDVSGERSVLFKYEEIVSWKELVKATDAAGKTTTYGYGPGLEANHVRKITDPDGHVTLIEYDETGRVTKIVRTTNSEHTTGPTVTLKYDEVGKAPAPCTSTQKATVITDPNGHTTTYCANSLDEVEKTIDASGNETSTKYNALGELSSTTAAAPGTSESGGVESLNYDESGRNLLCVIESSSASSACPTKSPSTSALVTSFKYKDESNPFSTTQVENPQGASTFACFNDGKQKESEGPACPTSEAGQPAGSLQNENDQLASEHELKFSYNENGTTKSSTDADGHTTEYAYDSQGNLKEVKPPVPLSPTTITVDADSRPHTITDGVGHIETITYNADSRITKIEYTGTGTARTVKFEYDGDGNVIKREDPTGTTKYTVDQLNRLTKEELPGSLSNTYEYDAASNMTAFIDGGGTTKYKYNALNE
ncbi:MAG TPA: DNRLRE domain-containing protein, partial [Solirubrobacteraceae bacterium]|nr:DNRLRE domain-containing protein [Solirubrobacteraceae bacterium]